MTWPRRAAGAGRRTPVLSAPAVVGRLRAVVCAPEGGATDGDRERPRRGRNWPGWPAAGVPGADPAQWYGMTASAPMEPLWSGAGHTVTLSPSTLQTLQDCPLRWLLERHGGADNAANCAPRLGSLVHALIAEPGSSRGAAARRAGARSGAQLPFDSQWFARNELDRHRAMLATFVPWREDTRHELTEVGTEVDVDGVLTAQRRDGGRARRCGCAVASTDWSATPRAGW